MLKFYKQTVSTYLNNEIVDTYSQTVLTDKELTVEKIKITWENLENIVYNLGLLLPFSYWNSYKGKNIFFFNYFPIGKNKKLKSIKEWKQKETNIYIEILYEECELSINEILDWHDGEKAMQYLKERVLIK